jgi:threonyl-tRNA synthetase
MTINKPIAIVLPNLERNIPYASEITAKLNQASIPTVLGDLRQGGSAELEKIGYRIRKAIIDDIPNILVIGDKEESTKTITRHKPDTSKEIPLSECISLIKESMKETL